MAKQEFCGIKRLRDLTEFGRFAQTIYVSKAHLSDIANQIEREHADELANAQRDLTDEARAVVERLRAIDKWEPWGKSNHTDDYRENWKVIEEAIGADGDYIRSFQNDLDTVRNRLIELIEHGTKQDVDVASLLEGAPKPNPYAMIAEDMGMGEGSIRACLAWYKTNQSNIDVAVARDVAADWVEAHGGLSIIQKRCFENAGVKYDVCRMLGLDDVDGDVGHQSIMSELNKRLMPPGCEWPRFEDGEKVVPSNNVRGDEDDEHIVWTISFCKNTSWGYRLYDEGGRVIHNTWMSCCERVKRPAPEVLGADREPIKVGETVWSLGGLELRVISLAQSEAGNAMVECLERGDAKTSLWFASHLTHTTVENQKRIDADARLNPREYWEARGEKGKEDRLFAQKIDLLRRQRELDAKTAGGTA